MRYAGDKDSHFYVITENVRRPDFSRDYEWKSWHEVGQAVRRIESETRALEILAAMFENSKLGMFTGFTDFEHDGEWFVTHQNEAVDLVITANKGVNGLSIYEGKRQIFQYGRLPKKLDMDELAGDPAKGLAPPYYVFPFKPDEYERENPDYEFEEGKWQIVVIIPAFRNQIFVELNTYPKKEDKTESIISENAHDLAELMVSEGMHLHSSWNSLVRDGRQDQHIDQENIERVLDEKIGRDSWRRLRFGWEVSTDLPDSEVVETVVEKIERLHELFFDGAQRRTEFPTPIE